MIIATKHRGTRHAGPATLGSAALGSAARGASTVAAGASPVAAATRFARALRARPFGARRAAARALTHERQRIAAGVHDLIMQDLSLALATARALAEEPGDAAQAEAIVSAGERALAGARQVLSELTTRDTRPIDQAVEASVRAAARHTQLAFHASLPAPTADVDEPTRDVLVHIAREAVTNAVKHARASTVEVVLEHAGHWRLTVHDDGRGFDEGPAGESFGLHSMHQSARSLGGVVRVGSASDGGTTVEAVLP